MAFEEIRQMKRRIAEELLKNGFSLFQFFVDIAPDENDLDYGVVSVLVTPSAFLTDEERAEQDHFNQEFAEIEKHLTILDSEDDGFTNIEDWFL